MATRIWQGDVDGDYSDTANWFGGNAPGAADDVRIPAGSGDIDGGDYSATAIGDFVVEPGYTGTIGDATTSLKIDPDAFRFEGLGQAYFNLHSAAISPQIFSSAAAATGLSGIYVVGSALVTINVMGGSVGIASRAGETTTVATIRVVGTGANVRVGKGTSLTTYYQKDGKGELHCAATTVSCFGGTLSTKEIGAITTLNVYGGNVTPESTGTITTLNCNGGNVDLTTSGAARTVTSLVINGGGVTVHSGVVTLTGVSLGTGFPLSISSQST